MLHAALVDMNKLAVAKHTMKWMEELAKVKGQLSINSDPSDCSLQCNSEVCPVVMFHSILNNPSRAHLPIFPHI